MEADLDKRRSLKFSSHYSHHPFPLSMGGMRPVPPSWSCCNVNLSFLSLRCLPQLRENAQPVVSPSLLVHIRLMGQGHINKPCGHATMNQCASPYMFLAACHGALLILIIKPPLSKSLSYVLVYRCSFLYLPFDAPWQPPPPFPLHSVSFEAQ